MESTDEILGCIKNIRYYSGEIKKSCQKQVESDFKRYEMNDAEGTSRLTVLGVISGALPHIENWLTNIEVNLDNADKLEPPRKEMLEESMP